MLYMTPGSGHTLRAPHIEAPEREFYVKWDQPAGPTAEAGIMWSAAKRWAKVMAATPGGALDIARYHHFTGSNHQLMLRGIDAPALESK
jgi:hypothetical protein